MSKCRFITLGNGQAYTTANELGRYMESRGIKFNQDASCGSRHFGSVFNRTLCAQDNKRACYGEESMKNHFPKLITVDSDGNSVHNNDIIVHYFLSNCMCKPNSVALCSKGFTCKGLDLYTVVAAELLVRYFGDAQNISFEEDDFELLYYKKAVPYLEYTKRLDSNPNRTSQKQIVPKYNEGVKSDDKNRYPV